MCLVTPATTAATTTKTSTTKTSTVSSIQGLQEALDHRSKQKFTNRKIDLPTLWSDLGLKYGAEVGVWKGEFSKQVLERMPQLESYTLIDSWRHLEQWNKPFNTGDKKFDQIFEQAMQVTKEGPYGNKVHVVRGTSLEAAPQIADNSFDFMYIDGDHTLKGIMIDMHVWYDKVVPGGIICGDDFAGAEQHDANFDPTMVKPYMEAFGIIKDVNIYDMGQKQFCFVKPL